MSTRKKQTGFTLIEVLMVTSIIALLLVSTAVYMRSSLERGRDGRRKADLRRLAELLEEHYNDKGTYPTELEMADCGSSTGNPLTKYQATIPCEPQSDINYAYIPEPTNCNGGSSPCLRYRLLTRLGYEEDPDIERVGCKPVGEGGCGGSTASNYNYGVAAGRTVSGS